MIFSIRRTAAVARKELKHLFRDHRMRPILFVAPVIQLVVLGLAANLDVEDVRFFLVDQDRTPVSREIAQRLDASPAFELMGVTDDEAVAERAIDDGTAEMVVVVPEGTQRGIARAEAVDLPLWVDGTDTNRGLQAQSYASQVLDRIARERLPTADLPVPVGRPDLRVRVFYNPALQSRWFMIPAVVVMVLGIISMLLSALAVVKEREQGTIEQLVVTPIRSSELILGKLLPFVVVGMIVTTLVTVAALAIFGVPFRGNPLTLVAMSLLFLGATLGLGLLASTLATTQQQAMLATMLILQPSFMLGGVFYPIGNMPVWAQRIADLSPIRYFVVMVRGVFLRGVGFEALAWETTSLAVLGFAVLTVAMLRFRKRSA